MLINGLTYEHYKTLVYNFLLYPEAWQTYVFGKNMETLNVLADIAIEIGGDLICKKIRHDSCIKLVSKTNGAIIFICQEHPRNLLGHRANTVIADSQYSLREFEEFFYPLANRSMQEVNYFDSDEVIKSFENWFKEDKERNPFYKDWKESLYGNKKFD